MLKMVFFTQCFESFMTFTWVIPSVKFVKSTQIKKLEKNTKIRRGPETNSPESRTTGVSGVFETPLSNYSTIFIITKER